MRKAAPPAPPPWYDPDVLKAWLRGRRWLVALVILPTLVSAFYLLALAADRYEAEARFMVRSPSSSAAGQLSALVQGTGVIRSADDAYIVHAYMESRDAVRALVEEYDLLARLQRPEADGFWGYPGVFRRRSDEGLWKHFQNFIDIDFDSSTGISTLRVQAFRPDDAQAIADGLLTKSEQLINEISVRSHQELLRAASAEVEASRVKAKEALDDVSAFRRQYELIDPTLTSKASLETITRLALEIARASADLEELRNAASDSPQALTLKRRVAAYQEQIAKERKVLAGSDTSLAPLIADYERLMLEREFTERAFASAQTAHDIARIDAERQRLFVERISSPSSPDYPKYPYRIFSILAIFATTWMLYAIGRRIASDSRAHAEN